MGMVIPWPGHPQGRTTRPFAEGEKRGEILFFTGVRYERHDPDAPADDADKPRRAPRGRRKRA